jgi:hypothetical protein
MTSLINNYTIIGILLSPIIFQQLTHTSHTEEIIYSGTVNPEPEAPVNDNVIETEPASLLVPEEPSEPSANDDDIIHCAALGCPGNPPNPHGPPTEEPESEPATTDES